MRYIKAYNCAHNRHKIGTISDCVKHEGLKTYGGYNCINCGEIVWELWFDEQLAVNARAERNMVAAIRDKIRENLV